MSSRRIIQRVIPRNPSLRAKQWDCGLHAAALFQRYASLVRQFDSKSSQSLLALLSARDQKIQAVSARHERQMEKIKEIQADRMQQDAKKNKNTFRFLLTSVLCLYVAAKFLPSIWRVRDLIAITEQQGEQSPESVSKKEEEEKEKVDSRIEKEDAVVSDTRQNMEESTESVPIRREMVLSANEIFALRVSFVAMVLAILMLSLVVICRF